MTVVSPAAEPHFTVPAPSDAGNGRQELGMTFEAQLTGERTNVRRGVADYFAT